MKFIELTFRGSGRKVTIPVDKISCFCLYSYDETCTIVDLVTGAEIIVKESYETIKKMLSKDGEE